MLKEDGHKDIIIDCLKSLVKDERIKLFAFTIMSDHIHLIWQPLQAFTLTQIQTSFMTYTAKAIQKTLSLENKIMLEELRVNKHYRTYQIWKREPLSIELFTEKAFLQKLDYIHQNPVTAGLENDAEDYKYSSAKFYLIGLDEFEIITYYQGD